MSVVWVVLAGVTGVFVGVASVLVWLVWYMNRNIRW
jgi:hypothetical protein